MGEKSQKYALKAKVGFGNIILQLLFFGTGN